MTTLHAQEAAAIVMPVTPEATGWQRATDLIQDVIMSGNEIHDPLARLSHQVAALQAELRSAHIELAQLRAAWENEA